MHLQNDRYETNRQTNGSLSCACLNKLIKGKQERRKFGNFTSATDKLLPASKALFVKLLFVQTPLSGQGVSGCLCLTCVRILRISTTLVLAVNPRWKDSWLLDTATVRVPLFAADLNLPLESERKWRSELFPSVLF